MINIEDYENEFVPRYRKKSKKKIKKADHRHIYEPCLVYWIDNIFKGERCSVCGKIGDINFFETEPVEGKPHFCKLLGGKEILNKYFNLDIYDYKTGEKVIIDDIENNR